MKRNSDVKKLLNNMFIVRAPPLSEALKSRRGMWDSKEQILDGVDVERFEEIENSIKSLGRYSDDGISNVAQVIVRRLVDVPKNTGSMANNNKR